MGVGRSGGYKDTLKLKQQFWLINDRGKPNRRNTHTHSDDGRSFTVINQTFLLPTDCPRSEAKRDWQLKRCVSTPLSSETRCGNFKVSHYNTRCPEIYIVLYQIPGLQPAAALIYQSIKQHLPHTPLPTPMHKCTNRRIICAAGLYMPCAFLPQQRHLGICTTAPRRPWVTVCEPKASAAPGLRAPLRMYGTA